MTRPLAAGSIIGSGTVSNRDADGGPGRPIVDGGLGYSCVAELRTVETIRDGKPQTPFLRFGSQVRIEMRDGEGQRSEEHTSALQSLMRISYAVFCLTKKTKTKSHCLLH